MMGTNSNTDNTICTAKRLARLLAVLMGTCAGSAVTCGSAAAQPAADQPTQGANTGLEEIVVTAQKRSENVQAVPISIQAISSNQLQVVGAKRLNDIESISPSVTFAKDNNQGETGIRGVVDYSRDAGVDARVGVYIDGVFLGRSWMNNVPLIDVDHIEVLNGPQGTLFGKNTDAGVINIVTKKPNDTFSGEASIDVGNYGYVEAAGRLNLPIIAGILDASLSADRAYGQNYMHNSTTGRDMSGVDHVSTRDDIRYRPSDSLDVLFSVDYLRYNDPKVFYTLMPAPGQSPWDYASPSNDFNNNETYGTTTSVDYHLDDGYTITDILDFHAGKEGRSLNGQGNVFLGIPSATVIGEYFEAEHQVSEELRLTSPKEEDYDFVVGLYYFNMSDHQYDPITFGTGFIQLGAPFIQYGGVPLISYAYVDTQSYAAYANANYRFWNGFELTGGLRYSYEEKQLDYSMFDPYQVILGYVRDYRDQRSFRDLSPKVSLSYHFNDKIMAYAGYSEGFKSGGWAADFDTNAQIQAGLRVNSEFAHDYEIGLKSTFWDGRARLNLAGFIEKFDQFQVFQVQQRMVQGQNVQQTALTNAGKVTSEGVEFQGSVQPVTGLTFSANVTYDRSRFDVYPGGAGTVNGKILDADGAQAPFAPMWKGVIGADYTYPVLPSADLIAHLDYRAQSKSASDAQYINPVTGYLYTQPSYHTVNARVGLVADDNSWEVDLWANNLMDGAHLIYSTVTTVGGLREVSYGPPRLYGVTFKYKFDAGSAPEETGQAYVPPPVVASAPAVPKSYLVFFDFNKSDLTPEATKVVDQAAGNAGAAKVTRIQFTGHTDTVGSDAYNMRLSRRRAESVAAELEKDGIPASEIAIVAKGKRDLLVPTGDGVREPQNRRVQIVYADNGAS